MIRVRGCAAKDAESSLAPFDFERRNPGPKDVRIEILYSGICHSDLHQARNHWGGSVFPMVPGHEIVGRVVEVGAEVKKLKVGDLAGVGCMVDSCRICSACKEDLEQYCDRNPASHPSLRPYSRAARSVTTLPARHDPATEGRPSRAGRAAIGVCM